MNIRLWTRTCVLLGMVVLTAPIVSFGEVGQRATVTPASAEQAYQYAPLFAFLREYFTVLAQGEVDKLALYHPSLTPQQLGTLQDYFAQTVRDLHIDIGDVRVQLVANTATVTFFRTDHFIDRLTGRRIEKSIRFSTALEYGSGWGWHLEGLDLIAFALGNQPGRAG